VTIHGRHRGNLLPLALLIFIRSQVKVQKENNATQAPDVKETEQEPDITTWLEAGINANRVQ